MVDKTSDQLLPSHQINGQVECLVSTFINCIHFKRSNVLLKCWITAYFAKDRKKMKVFVVLSCIALAVAKPQGYSYNQPSNFGGSHGSGISAPSIGLSTPSAGK